MPAGSGRAAALGLLLAGWAVRWRGRPPLGAWLGYRFFDRRLPREERAWIADDIDGRWFPWRQGVGVPVLVTAQWVLVRWHDPHLLVLVQMVALLAAVVLVADLLGASEPSRRAARRRHLLAAPGERLVPGSFVVEPVPQARVPARWALRRWSVVLLAVVVMQVPAALVGPSRLAFVSKPVGPNDLLAGVGAAVLPMGAARWVVVGALALGAVAGLVLAVRARSLLPGVLDTLGPQPDRQVRRPAWRADARVATLVLLLAADAWAEATGRLVVGLGAVLGGVALALLPWVLVLRRSAAARGWAARDGSELTWRDLSWTGVRSAPVPVDEPVDGMSRWDGPADAVAPRRTCRRTPVGRGRLMAGAGGDGRGFERSARFWLRAYPRRWRRDHTEEVLGVLADLAEPGARASGRGPPWACCWPAGRSGGAGGRRCTGGSGTACSTCVCRASTARGSATTWTAPGS